MKKAPLIRDGSLWMQAVLLSQCEAMQYRLAGEERERECMLVSYSFLYTIHFLRLIEERRVNPKTGKDRGFNYNEV